MSYFILIYDKNINYLTYEVLNKPLKLCSPYSNQSLIPVVFDNYNFVYAGKILYLLNEIKKLNGIDLGIYGVNNFKKYLKPRLEKLHLTLYNLSNYENVFYNQDVNLAEDASLHVCLEKIIQNINLSTINFKTFIKRNSTIDDYYNFTAGKREDLKFSFKYFMKTNFN